MNFAIAIKELRKEKMFTQSDLSKKTGLTQATICNIEGGQRPGVNTLEKISKALEVPPSFIYLAAIEREEVPEEKQLLYDKLFPVIKMLVKQLV